MTTFHQPGGNASSPEGRTGNASGPETRTRFGDSDHRAMLDAIGRSHGVIEFDLDGTILTANENFLRAMGYTLDEIRGKHHRMLVDDAYAESEAYRSFWDRLNRGEYIADEFLRVGKGGRDVSKLQS
jgi:methyl-accepting chemotaxis protein